MSRLTSLKSFLVACALVFGAVFVSPAAIAGPPEIDRAKAEGIVGERIDGYLGVVEPDQIAPATLRKVEEINAKRRAVYADQAADAGATVEQMARVTGEALVARASAGEYVLEDAGRWRRK